MQMRRLNDKRQVLGRVGSADMHLFRVFQTVAQCGGFSAAQSELGVGRSTVSRQIGHLEDRLGYTLCHRGRSGFALTQHGEQALKYINVFLSAADDFASNMAGINEDFVGSINVAMIDFSFSDQANPMIKAIKAYHERAPKVSINLSIESPNQIERGVIEGKYHLGILPDYRRLDGLRYDVVYHETVELFAGRDHPLGKKVASGIEPDLEEVFKHELVYRGYLEGDRLADIKKEFRRGATVLQTESVLVLLNAGIYLGFMPSHSATADVVSVRPDKFRYSVPICATTRSSRSRSLILNAFLEDLLSRS
ncbi:MAG: HTH-type transcriptional activator BauR [Rhizobiaceae bacterium]